MYTISWADIGCDGRMASDCILFGSKVFLKVLFLMLGGIKQTYKLPRMFYMQYSVFGRKYKC